MIKYSTIDVEVTIAFKRNGHISKSTLSHCHLPLVDVSQIVASMLIESAVESGLTSVDTIADVVNQEIGKCVLDSQELDTHIPPIVNMA